MGAILDTSILTPTFAVSGPSGGGKGTLTDFIMSLFPDLFYRGVSMTTRKPRNKEIPGVHYHFVTEREFKQRIVKEHFIEYKDVHGNLYGTLRTEFIRAQKAGKTFLIDLDVKGSDALKCDPVISKCLYRLFITVPDSRDLYERILLRSKDTEVKASDIVSRVATGRLEMARAAEFDGVIVNGDLAVAKVEMLELLSYFLMSCRAAKLEVPRIEDVEFAVPTVRG